MLRIEVLLACSHQHRIPVSAYAHGHVSIIRARSDAGLGIGILTIDSNKVLREQEADRRARLR